MSFDVFISYSTKDSAAANAACAALESAKIRCWMAPRDILPGERWGASIVRAIDQCRVMVLIFSGNANVSAQVHREVDQAFGRSKAVLPLRIEPVRPADELAYYLDTVHWLDTLTPPLERDLTRLVETVQALLPMTAPVPSNQEPTLDDVHAAQEQEEARAKDEQQFRQAEATQATLENGAESRGKRQEANPQELCDDPGLRKDDGEQKKSNEQAPIAPTPHGQGGGPAEHVRTEAKALRASLPARDDADKNAMTADDVRDFPKPYPKDKEADAAQTGPQALTPKQSWRPSRRVLIVAGGAAAIGATAWLFLELAALRLDGYYYETSGSGFPSYLRFYGDGSVNWVWKYQSVIDEAELNKLFINRVPGDGATNVRGSYEVAQDTIKISFPSENLTGTILHNALSLTETSPTRSKHFDFRPWDFH